MMITTAGSNTASPADEAGRLHFPKANINGVVAELELKTDARLLTTKG